VGPDLKVKQLAGIPFAEALESLRKIRGIEAVYRRLLTGEPTEFPRQFGRHMRGMPIDPSRHRQNSFARISLLSDMVETVKRDCISALAGLQSRGFLRSKNILRVRNHHDQDRYVPDGGRIGTSHLGVTFLEK